MKQNTVLLWAGIAAVGYFLLKDSGGAGQLFTGGASGGTGYLTSLLDQENDPATDEDIGVAPDTSSPLDSLNPGIANLSPGVVSMYTAPAMAISPAVRTDAFNDAAVISGLDMLRGLTPYVQTIQDPRGGLPTNPSIAASVAVAVSAAKDRGEKSISISKTTGANLESAIRGASAISKGAVAKPGKYDPKSGTFSGSSIHF
jgi:hypothetical protein